MARTVEFVLNYSSFLIEKAEQLGHMVSGHRSFQTTTVELVVFVDIKYSRSRIYSF